ncbi:MAG: molybdopterin-synthase adenylyltransferase MoeB [Betaproteobacteria bacterium]|nr:molybdopterin-synthase adenylyltransferase MoeB [Betaproteobacteria bacterium]
MNDSDLLRYSRHILLNEFGVEAQEKLARSHALVVGAGGLGSAALLYLASAGVARITIADGDAVDLTNLQRQIVHRESGIGSNKALSARQSLAALNSSIDIHAIERRLSGEELRLAVEAADVVLDCSDNFATRHAINRACVQARKPLVSGAAIRFDGQITTFDFRNGDSPCYHCLFADKSADQPDGEEERCAVMGVFAPLVGIIGATQAAEAIRLLTGVGTPLTGRLQMLDGLNMRWQSVTFTRDPHCAVCAVGFAEKSLEVLDEMA